MFARALRRVERHLGLVLPLLVVLALWHPNSNEADTLPPRLSNTGPSGAPRLPPHFLTPDAYRVVVELGMERLLVMKGNLLMTVYPIEEREDREPAERVPEGSFLVAELSRRGSDGPAIHLVYADEFGADRALSSGRIDRMTHASILDSLARGEVPASSLPLGSGPAIRTARATTGAQEGIVLDEEYLHQLIDVLKIGTPVEIRRS